MSNPKKPKAVRPTETPQEPVSTLRYAAKRKNIPAAGLEAQGRIQEVAKIKHEYNPHLPPVLRSALAAKETDQLIADLQKLLSKNAEQSDKPRFVDEVRQLIDKTIERPLTAQEAARIQALFESMLACITNDLRRHEPWLEWSGKREKPWFEVEPVALHMHERVSTQAILRVLAREDVQRDLFADPQQSYSEAVQFYRHEIDWANRMILGDSLQVMASLARREDLAGKVQMIYFDPPYGIKFSSNFQPQLGQRDVKDREQDLTREPEMVRAYRDTWTLGIHSYLAYLRDRLAMAKELLTDSGSIFVQISDENLHRVRCLLDEVFGSANFQAQIAFVTTGGQSTERLAGVYDILLWYAKDSEKTKFQPIFTERELREGGGWAHSRIEWPNGVRENVGVSEVKALLASGQPVRPYTQDTLDSSGATPTGSDPFAFQGRIFKTPPNTHWKTSQEGLSRLGKAERLEASTNSLRLVKFFADFPVQPINNIWDDTTRAGYIDEKRYVVQTSTKVIERCLLMTTDPGDLVLDPTCGSGTTAYVAEHWGRRWITIDTSRVALALAKQRLLTARFPYFKLRPLNPDDLARNPKGVWLKNGGDEARTFQCKTVPHITLRSIARNASLDPIFAKHEPLLADKLAALNSALAAWNNASVRGKLIAKLEAKARDFGLKKITDADLRRWLLPGTLPTEITFKKAAKLRDRIPPENHWRDWEAPFDTDPDWPDALAQALTDYRAAWRAKMDEVNACIAANADMEELVDKPDEEKGVVRVSGPFTMEGVIALEDGPDSPIAGAPETLDAFDDDADPDGTGDGAAVVNAEAHLDKVRRLLAASGVDFPGNKNMRFARLDAITDASLIHAEGEWSSDEGERRVAVSIGPEVGNLTAFQVEDTIRAANRRGYDEVVFAAFGFDAAAQAVIEEASHPTLRLHMALIRPDVAMGELLKTQPGNQIFTVFSAPRVKGPTPRKDGEYVVEVEGMDVYDPVSNQLYPTDKDRIAAWFLDSDYDGRTFCVCQAFFPDKGKWAKLAKALGEKGVIEEEKFAALSGLVSLPFVRPAEQRPGQVWRVAVKVIDPRGNEGLRVVEIR